MTTELWNIADDDGTYTIRCDIKDPDGVAIPAADISSITWTLTDNAGTVINGRSAVSAVVANPLDIVLGAADLDFSDGAERLISIDVVYDLGELTDSASFAIQDPGAAVLSTLRGTMEDDLDVFYNEDEHAEAADYEGNNILVIESGGDHLSFSPGFDVPVYTVQFRASEVPNPKAGDEVTFRGGSYRVGPMIRAQKDEWIVDLIKNEIQA